MKTRHPRTHKYNAKRTTVNGITFPSRLEAQVYACLLADQEDGRITDLELQPEFVLQDEPRIVYRADFAYTDTLTSERVIVEAKGKPTPVWKLKEKLFRAKYPDLDLRVIGKPWR